MKTYTFQETVSWCYKNYPSLFINELDVLEQLFFIIGNGYEWYNGCLIPCGHTREEEHEYVTKTREHHNKENLKRQNEANSRFFSFMKENNILDSEKLNALMEKFQNLFEPETDDWKFEQQKEYKKRIKYAQDPRAYNNKCYFLDSTGNLIQRIYPISGYSEILNLPDDIQPDWLEAAKLAIQYCDEGRWILTDSDKQYIVQAKEIVLELSRKNE